jgi:hypothetical protein
VSLCLSRSLWFHPATICYCMRLDASARGMLMAALRFILQTPVNYCLSSECCLLSLYALVELQST